MIRRHRPASRRSRRGLSELGWITAATCASISLVCRRSRRTRRYAAELVALDAGRRSGFRHASAVRRATVDRTVPIVLHIGRRSGRRWLVDSLARPGGNVTGFMLFEYEFERQMAGAAQARSRRA